MKHLVLHFQISYATGSLKPAGVYTAVPVLF